MTDVPQPRPPNATKNPFVEATTRPFKRMLDVESTGENYIFGNVQQPMKRSRIGKFLYIYLKQTDELITTIDKPKESQESLLLVINVDVVIPLRSVP